MQEQLQQTLEQQLRDVHLPEAISWWPLAVGWWILIAIVLLLLVLLVWHFRKRHRRNLYRKTAIEELQLSYTKWKGDQDSASYLQSANTILKRCLLHLSNHKSDVTTTGEAWLAILKAYARQPLSDEVSFALSDACYQAEPQVAVNDVHPQIRRWISSHREAPHA